MFDSREGQNCFFSTVSRPTVEYTQPPVQRGNRGLIPQGKTQPKVHKNWGRTSTSPSGTISSRRYSDEENDHNIIIIIIIIIIISLSLFKTRWIIYTTSKFRIVAMFIIADSQPIFHTYCQHLNDLYSYQISYGQFLRLTNYRHQKHKYDLCRLYENTVTTKAAVHSKINDDTSFHDYKTCGARVTLTS